MYLSFVFLCFLALGAAQSLGPQYRVPSIYTPLSPTIQPYQHPLYYYNPEREPLAAPQPNPLLQYYATSNLLAPQPQPQPQQSYPPNSLILIYYRQKNLQPASSVQSTASTLGPLEPTPVVQDTKPRIETPASRLSNICKGEGIVPHPEDCFKFIRCKLSVQHHVYYYEERTCPRGLAFDSNLESCNYKARVSTCPKIQFQSHGQPQSTLPTQSLLTYHGELPELSKDSDKAEDSHTPSLYHLELPQPLGESSEDAISKSEHTDDELNSDIPSAPLVGKNAESGLKTVPSSPPADTKTVKKPTNGNKKSPSRSKTSPKRPGAGTKSPQGTKTKPVTQQKETIEPAKSTPQVVESFSIGDSSENARMVLDSGHNDAPTKPATSKVSVPSTLSEAEEGVSQRKLVPGVRYEDDENGDEDSYTSTV